VSAETVLWFEAMGVRIERHPERKRDTDAALALAGLKGHDEVLFLGPGGGRVDHALANLHLLVAASAWARAWAVDDDARIHVVTPERPLSLDLPAGALLSVLPWDGRCEGITYQGLRYHLEDATMTEGDPYGMSNVCEAAPQQVRVRSGRLLVVVPTGPR
jgi:thiamine pyrophosphokinase